MWNQTKTPKHCTWWDFSHSGIRRQILIKDAIFNCSETRMHLNWISIESFLCEKENTFCEAAYSAYFYTRRRKNINIKVIFFRMLYVYWWLDVFIVNSAIFFLRSAWVETTKGFGTVSLIQEGKEQVRPSLFSTVTFLNSGCATFAVLRVNDTSVANCEERSVESAKNKWNV